MKASDCCLVCLSEYIGLFGLFKQAYAPYVFVLAHNRLLFSGFVCFPFSFLTECYQLSLL